MIDENKFEELVDNKINELKTGYENNFFDLEYLLFTEALNIIFFEILKSIIDNSSKTWSNLLLKKIDNLIEVRNNIFEKRLNDVSDR